MVVALGDEFDKPNPMPESCRDRPTSAYEMVFLLAKSATYFYDADAVREAAESNPADKRRGDGSAYRRRGKRHSGKRGHANCGLADDGKRNLRNVWTITPKPYRGAHFAAIPVDLAVRCILAGSRFGDTVLDPFGGASANGACGASEQPRRMVVRLNQLPLTLPKRDCATARQTLKPRLTARGMLA